MFISLAIVFTMLFSVTAFAQNGDVTGGEEHLDQYGHSLALRSQVPSTCVELGSKTYYCEICDQEFQFDDTEYAPHTESDWIIDLQATAEAAGHKYKECTVCHTVLAEDDIPQIITTHIAGDINRDGAVNNKDLTRLFQYVSDWGVEVDEAVLDVNGDGSVNNKDLTRLFQYLSDWDVESFGVKEDPGEQQGGGGAGGTVINDSGTIFLPEVP